MRTIRTALLVLVAFGTLTPAFAQRAPSSPPPPPSAAPAQPPPPVFYDPWGRGPPPPPERSYVGPGSQVSPPMPRVEPIAPLSPRVGN